MLNLADINRQIAESIQKEIDITAQNIKDNMQLNNQYATGATEASIRTEAGADFGVIWGAEHIDTLEKGISPERSKMRSFVESATGINLWQAAKGLGLDEHIVSMITKKQRLVGSRLYRSGGRDDVYTKEVAPLTERIGNAVSDKIINIKIIE